MPYIILNFFLCLLLLIVTRILPFGKKNNDRIFLLLTFILLLFFRTFINPYSVTDLPAYLDVFTEACNKSFSEIPQLAWYYDMELGYLYFNKIVSLVWPNFHFLLFVISFILLSCYYKIITQYSPYIGLSVLLFLLTIFNQSLFVLRQHTAMALFVIALPYIEKGKLLKFSILLIIATLFHKSAIITFPLYFFYQIKNRKKYILLMILVTLLLGTLYMTILKFLGSQLGYDGYVSNARYGGANYIGFFIMLLIFSAYLFFLREKSFQISDNKLFLSCLIIGLLGTFFGVGNSSTGRLFAYYTSITPIFAVPIIAKYIKAPSLKYIFCVSVLVFYFYIAYFGSSSHYFKAITFI